jgi:alkyl hydroperoxide reductase subunit AhpF
MALLSTQDEQALKQHLSEIQQPVTVLLFTQTIGGSETGPVARQVLDEVARLNDKITIQEKSFVLDQEDRARYGVDKAPAIVVLANGQDTRMRIYGAPVGYEFVGLVEALLIAGTGKLDLQDGTLAMIGGVSQPTHIQVFSTPT